jgi:DeoR/GlpR family transcriptional regulator of sugar metabolism
VAFFSCRGVSDEGFLTDIARDENIVRQRMIQNAKKTYLLCATEKFGKAYYHNLCHKDDLTGIIHE